MDNLTSEKRLAEAERLIAEMYRFSGTSREVDFALYKKAQAYCKKHRVADVQDMEWECKQ